MRLRIFPDDCQAAMEEILDGLKSVIKQGFSEERQKKKILIIKAEGVAFPTPLLVEELQSFVDQAELGISVRAAVVGHLVRGGAPSYRDRMIAGRFGVEAVEAGSANPAGPSTPASGIGGGGGRVYVSSC